ncbi:MAG: tetratricopeptide repeat protein [Actinobacteria bacterium]|nr:MAG: tetratricopeptide repeat protein [Actinomycetota bacterium]
MDASSASPTDRAIATAQARLAAAPRDSQGLLDLARAFLQKVRETGDPTLYSKAGGILHDLARRTPDDLGVLVTQGTLDLALHRFGEARRVGRRAVRLFPDSPEARGVLVDADNELGLYAEAGAQTQAMADLRPDLASLSRASYARSAAVEAGGGGGGENVAYVQAQLGTLLLTSGDTSGAEAAYASAERSFPGFASARAGRAAVLVARGQPGQAADALEGVVRDQPLALYAIARGDDLAAARRPSEAADAYALVRVLERLFAANGVDVDLELALFDADHGGGPGALARARRGERARPSAFGHDVLAWALYRTGRLDEAARESDRALSLGSRDPLLNFHAAAISVARGDRAEAASRLGVVLAANPRMSAGSAADVAALAGRLGLPLPGPR